MSTTILTISTRQWRLFLYLPRSRIFRAFLFILSLCLSSISSVRSMPSDSLASKTSSAAAADSLPSPLLPPSPEKLESPANALLGDNFNLTAPSKQKQYDDDDPPCIRPGHACETYVNHRLCCKGKCQLFPNGFLQFITFGGLGICH